MTQPRSETGFRVAELIGTTQCTAWCRRVLEFMGAHGRETCHMNLRRGFRLGEWSVQPLRGELIGPKGARRLQPKAMDVLLCLVERAPDVVERDTLVTAVWGPGAVSDEPLTRCIGDLRKQLGDRRGSPCYVETIPKRGYRLLITAEPLEEGLAELEPSSRSLENEDIGEQRVKNITDPMHAYRVAPSSGQELPVRPFARKTKGITRWIWTTAATFTVIGIIVLALIWNPFERGVEPSHEGGATVAPIPAIPSIAVLPFENLSGDSDQEYFSDGVTENIITGLSRVPSIRVIARNSTFVYKGKAVDPRQLARDLGAHYVVEGSVRLTEDTVRITAQLIDASTGHHTWANSYENTGADIFALQDELTKKVVASLGGLDGWIKKAAEDRAWAKNPVGLEEYDYYLRGLKIFFRYTKKDMVRAREIWQEGLARFAGSPLLRVSVAWTYYNDARKGWSDNPKRDYDRALRLTEEALANDKLSLLAEWSGHWMLANLYTRHKKDFVRALRERELTLSLVPNSPEALITLCQVLLPAGKPDEAIEAIEKALELHPTNIPVYTWRYLGWAYYLKGKYRQAVDNLEKYPRSEINNNLLLAASYAQLGEMDRAKAAVVKMREINPRITLSSLGEFLGYKNQSDLERVLSDLKKAGLPD